MLCFRRPGARCPTLGAKATFGVHERRVGSIFGRFGREVEVLVEGQSLRNAERWSGRSRENKITVFDPVPGVNRGDTVTVAVDRAGAQTLYGKVDDK